MKTPNVSILDNSIYVWRAILIPVILCLVISYVFTTPAGSKNNSLTVREMKQLFHNQTVILKELRTTNIWKLTFTESAKVDIDSTRTQHSSGIRYSRNSICLKLKNYNAQECFRVVSRADGQYFQSVRSGNTGFRINTRYLKGLPLPTRALSGGDAVNDPILKIQKPQASPIKKIRWSQGNELLATLSEDQIIIWEAKHGRILRTISITGEEALDFNFSDGGDHLITIGKGTSVIQISNGEKQYYRLGRHPDVAAAAISSSAKFAAVAYGNNFLVIWDLETRRAVRQIRTAIDIYGLNHAVAISSTGRYVALSGPRSEIQVWRVRDGRLVHVFKAKTKEVQAQGATAPLGLESDVLTFSKNGAYLASGGKDGRIRLWSLKGERQLLTEPAHNPQHLGEGEISAFESVSFHPEDDRLLTTGLDGEVKLWRYSRGQIALVGTNNQLPQTTATFSIDGKQVAAEQNGFPIILSQSLEMVDSYFGKDAASPFVAISLADDVPLVALTTDTSVFVWNTNSSRRIANFEIERASSIALSPDGSRIVTGHYDGRVNIWNVGSSKLLNSGGSTRPISFPELGVSDEEPSVVVAETDASGLRALSAGKDGIIRIWDIETGRLIKKIVAHQAYLEGEEGASVVGVTAAVFCNDSTRIASLGADNKLKIWDVRTGKLLKELEVLSHGGALSCREQSGLIVFHENNFLSYVSSRTLRRVNQTSLWKKYSDITFSKMSNTFLELDSYSGQIIFWNELSSRPEWGVKPTGGLVAAKLSADGKRLFVVTKEGALQVWDIADIKPLITVVGTELGNWVAITPSGFFDASRHGWERLLHVSQGNDTVAISEVYEHLLRPDLVQKLLTGDVEGEFKNAAFRLNLQKILESGAAPQLEHIMARAERIGNSLRLGVRITGRGGGVGEKLVWRVNGIAQGDPRPDKLAGLKSPLASAVVTETLKLVPGQKNIIEVVAYNRAGLLATSPLKIIVDKFGVTTKGRPRMFVLALGVDNYRMKSYRLSYAAHDARTISKALKVAGGGLFSDVHTTTLTNDEVNANDISAAINDISDQIEPQDVFVLFLGGHGKSIAGRYYYYPQTLDFAAGQTVEQHGIGQDQWEAWLRKLSVQKSLLVIDTCEGDAFRGSRSSDVARQTAMTQLEHATGRNIIAAARDAAYEGYKGHGVLTYAILEALDRRASPLKDATVRIAALAEYVGKRVPAITQKSFGIYQNPTRKLSGNDFPIGIRQEVLQVGGAGPAISKIPTHVVIKQAILRERPASDAPAGRALPPGTQVRAVEFIGNWVVVARGGQKIGYLPLGALVRLQ